MQFIVGQINVQISFKFRKNKNDKNNNWKAQLKFGPVFSNKISIVTIGSQSEFLKSFGCSWMSG